MNIKKMVKLDENSESKHYVLRGQKYLIKGDVDNAIRSYQKALRISSKRPKAQLFLGNAWLKKGVKSSVSGLRKDKNCFRKAIRHYNRAEKLSPDSIIGDWARRKKREIESLGGKIIEKNK